MREHAKANCKPATVENYRWALESYILPELGDVKVAEVDRKRVTDLHYELREKPFTANRVLVILSKMLSLAEVWNLRATGTNPRRFVRRYPERQRERFLTREEFRRLGAELDEAEADGSVHPSAVAAIRLLMLTGCRKGEILGLKWDDVDRTAGELRLRGAKSGPRMVPLTAPVLRVLDGIPRARGNPWVIRGRRPGTHLTDLAYHWTRIAARAGLEGVRIHDLRHSYASRALALGETLPMIGRLLGHSQMETTARYAHLARDTIRDSAARIADSIADDIFQGSSV